MTYADCELSSTSTGTDKPRRNFRAEYRTCSECMYTLGWPRMQPSLRACPYCGAPYHHSTKRERSGRVMFWVLMALAVAAVALFMYELITY